MAYINILEQPQVNETDSLLGIKDDKVVQIDSKDSCLSGLSNLTEVQKQQVREDINALEDEAGVIDTEHLATGAVTTDKIGRSAVNTANLADYAVAPTKIDRTLYNQITKGNSAVVWINLTSDIFEDIPITKTINVDVPYLGGYNVPPLIGVNNNGRNPILLYPFLFSSGDWLYTGNMCYNIYGTYAVYDILLNVPYKQMTITKSLSDVGICMLEENDADFESDYNELSSGDSKSYFVKDSLGFGSKLSTGKVATTVIDSKGVVITMFRINSFNRDTILYECTTSEGATFQFNGDDITMLKK